jgi:hypothetical protein
MEHRQHPGGAAKVMLGEQGLDLRGGVLNLGVIDHVSTPFGLCFKLPEKNCKKPTGKAVGFRSLSGGEAPHWSR